MKNYKIFTYDEFNERVKLWWNLMVEPEFNIGCVSIEHDIAKRRTSNLGKAHYERTNGKVKPSKLSFSFRLLDGRYTIELIDDIIKHEIWHHLDTLRNGYSRESHGHKFRQIAEEFSFNGSATIDLKNYTSDIYLSIIEKEYKFFSSVRLW